ncbi:hypothetical protein J6590_047471 [Homalodisca vitripennis]|nr:hypothetical protein J6590_047471 [Homalodisca vitripennis]
MRRDMDGSGAKRTHCLRWFYVKNPFCFLLGCFLELKSWSQSEYIPLPLPVHIM